MHLGVLHPYRIEVWFNSHAMLQLCNSEERIGLLQNWARAILSVKVNYGSCLYLRTMKGVLGDRAEEQDGSNTICSQANKNKPGR